MEKFNPNNPEYKSVEDLPEKKRKSFVNDPKGRGFIRKEGLEAYKEELYREKLAERENEQRSLIDKITGRNKTSAIEIAHEEALEEDLERTKNIEKTKKLAKEKKLRKKLEPKWREFLGESFISLT